MGHGSSSAAVPGPSGSPACLSQLRFKNQVNSISLLAQMYCRLSIRKKWRTAIKKGTMMWDPKIGQVVIPPLQMQGYSRDAPYKGKWENCKSVRVEFEK